MQIIYLEPYSDEQGSIFLLQAFMEANGQVDETGSERIHQEIYLLNPRKAAPEKLKTVLRLPVALADLRML